MLSSTTNFKITSLDRVHPNPHLRLQTTRTIYQAPIAQRLVSSKSWISTNQAFTSLRRSPTLRQRQPLVVANASNTGSKSTILTLPTILTLGRVAAIPALVYYWFAQQWLTCLVLFTAASITDYLDGYLARKMNASSPFGAFLDPVADKLMVATVMILLSTLPVPSGALVGNNWILPLLTCVIIGREITMSALREWAAALGPEAHSAVAVSWLGKWKTATQMVSITLLLAARSGLGEAVDQVAAAAGLPLLGLAAVFTVWSLFEYFGGLWKFMT